MADPTSPPKPNQGTTRRVRYLLHRSTCILLLPVAVVLVLIMVAGAPYDYWERPGYQIHFSGVSYPTSDFGLWCHGWPWRYLKTESQNPTFVELRDPVWLSRNAWWGGDVAREWNFWALGGNLAVAIGVMLLVAALLELRRRRHTSFFQFSL